MMKIARVLACDVDDNTRRIMLLCGLDQESFLVEGEWMGYAISSTARCPFVLTGSQLEYEGESEVHNFAMRPIIANELFTINEQGGGEAATYRIQSIVRYESIE